MPSHPFHPHRGTVEYLTIESEAVAGNVLGDPSTRRVAVYLPPGYATSGEEYPLFVDLVGFSGSGLAHLNWRPFGESVLQRLDRLVEQGRMGPVVLALPDCFTSLGGCQYINSAAAGNWEDFLIDEMLPAIEERFRVRPGRDHRAVFGKSSGGFGAISHGLIHGDAWGAVACHSGDMGFAMCYATDFADLLDAVAPFDRDLGKLLAHYAAKPKIDRNEFHMLELMAMAAFYDPDPTRPMGVRMPVDLFTGELIEDRWANWLSHDPVDMADRPECLDSLRSLRGLYIDCGTRDQYALVYGARALTRKLREAGVSHHFEEFDDDHTAVDYRQDVSLPFLYEAVAGER